MDDIEVVLIYKDERFAYGDMYEDIRSIETNLHRLVREALEEEHGRDNWWRRGVPQSIRVRCATRREEDDEPVDEPYAYTDLLDLSKITEKEWKPIRLKLPKEVAANRTLFVAHLEKLNRIRRLVMHPVRGPSPSEEDFQFVHNLKRELGFMGRVES